MERSNSQGAGGSALNGPAPLPPKSQAGWELLPVRHWDFTEGRLPQ